MRVFLPGNTPPKQAEKHLTAGFPSQGDGGQNLSGPVPSLGSSRPLSLVPHALMFLVIMNPGQVVWMKPRVVFVLGHLPWAWAHRDARASAHGVACGVPACPGPAAQGRFLLRSAGLAAPNYPACVRAGPGPGTETWLRWQTGRRPQTILPSLQGSRQPRAAWGGVTDRWAPHQGAGKGLLQLEAGDGAGSWSSGWVGPVDSEAAAGGLRAASRRRKPGPGPNALDLGLL